MKPPALNRGLSPVYLTSCYVQSLADLLLSNLKYLKVELVKSISPPIRLHGLLGIPALLCLFVFVTVSWLSVFFLVPMLLLFVWIILQPYRLWLRLKNLMIGKNFSR